MRLGLKTERKNNRKAQIKLELKLLNPVTASATIKTSRTTLDNYATKSLFFRSKNEGTRPKIHRKGNPPSVRPRASGRHHRHRDRVETSSARGLSIAVDGKPVAFADTMNYKGVMSLMSPTWAFAALVARHFTTCRPVLRFEPVSLEPVFLS